MYIGGTSKLNPHGKAIQVQTFENNKLDPAKLNFIHGRIVDF